MSILEWEFLEKYKRLDKLCSEIYQTRNGISAYIEDMTNTPYGERKQITQWNEDLQRLWALRSLRNRLVHECDTLDMELCESDDIDWLESFYQRILHCADPMALLHRRKMENVSKTVPQYESKTPFVLQHEYSTDHAEPVLRNEKYVFEEAKSKKEIIKHSNKQTIWVVLLLLTVLLLVFACVKVLVILL